jgi:Tfp pilus assembly protein PilF
MRTMPLRNLIPLLCFSTACAHVPTEKERQGAQIHYDLGVQLLQSDPQQAFREFELSLQLDPEFVEAHHAIAVLLHISFKRHDDAEVHYRKALALRPDFSEGKTNLGNLLLDVGRYAESIVLYEQALNDMLYSTPFIAHGNMGWAYYKMGNESKAISEIRSALTLNPRFCLGLRNLGIIYMAQEKLSDACKSFGQFRECSESAEAYFKEGSCLAQMGDRDAAFDKLRLCVSKSTGAQRNECEAMLSQMGH